MFNCREYNSASDYSSDKIKKNGQVVVDKTICSVCNIGNNSIKEVKGKYFAVRNNYFKLKKKNKQPEYVVKKTTSSLKKSYILVHNDKKIISKIRNEFKLINNSIKTIAFSTKVLIELLIAGGWIVALIIIILCAISLLFNSMFGIFYTNEKIDNGITMGNVILTLNNDLNKKIESIKEENSDITSSIIYNEANWRDILILYSVKQSRLNNGFINLLDDRKMDVIRKIFWDMNEITVKIEEVEVGTKKLIITVSGKSLNEMIDKYGLTEFEISEVKELSDSRYDSLWNNIIGGSSLLNGDNNYAFPVGGLYTITQYFHNDHKALDISSNYGSNIYAVSDGTIYLVKGGCIVGDLSCNGKGGNYVIIKHNDNRYYSVYMHLKDYIVKKDDKVEKGQIIGYMGNTGNVEPRPIDSNSRNGTHLHFVIYDGEPYVSGVEINPSTFYHI